MSTERTWPLFAVLAALVVALAATSVLVGYAPIAPGRILAGLFAGGDSPAALIARELRLPRAVLAASVGASLGLSGAALQGLLRNPLAEPAVIGISASAGLGAVIALYFGFAAWAPVALPLAGMLGGLGGMALLIVLAGRDQSAFSLILAGVALSSLAGALTALALNLSPSPYAMSEMLLWLLGSLRNATLQDLGFALPFMVAGWVLLLGVGPGLDALTLGDDAARSLGVDMARLRLRVIGGTALAVGASVAVAGIIGFVGLVVPHWLRPWTGYRPSALLPSSALAGAALLLAADLGVRLMPTQTELAIGVVTALIGAPFFLHLVLTVRRRLP
jgi:iron complex transport system permease protein